MRISYITLCKSKRTLKWLCIIILSILCIVLNFQTNLFAFNISADNVHGNSDLSVMCYNVKCRDSLYKENQIEIAKLILKESPDVVFLCEFNLSVSKELDSIIRQSRGYKQYYRSKSNCIYYSKYEIDSIMGIDTQTSKGKCAKNNIVHVSHPKGIVTIVGCHLSSSRKDIIGGFRKRVLEADSIYEALCDEKSPTIVMGDLNDVSGLYTISRIKDAGLSDAWWEGGCGYGSTFHCGWLRLRLDHILYDKSRIKLNKIKVLESDLSDHNALIASFSLI